MTTRTATPISLALVLALFAVPMAPLASGGSHGAGSTPAESWTAVTAALDEGSVDEARSTYEQRFQDVASKAPRAKAAIEQAWGPAQQAGQGTAGYTVAAQIVEKALLAVAYAQIHDAAATGDVETASAYFEVLATKFDGEAELPYAKDAFSNLTEGTLDTTIDALDTEYRALITSKVYHEADETPGLLEGGDVATAAKEAAEAQGYAFSVLDHVGDVLGNGTADTLHAELGELVEFALAGETEAAREEAEEIQEILAMYGLATLPSEKVDAFERFETALEEQRFDDAEALYGSAFQEEATEYASQADRRIQTAFTEARQAQSEDRTADLGVQLQILEKTVLDIAWQVGFHELAEDEIHESLEWLAPLAATFGWIEQWPEEGLPLGHLAASGDAKESRVQAAQTALAERLVDKVREEVEETFINWDDPATAREKAIEGVVYARPAQGWLEAELGQAPTDELFEELETLYNHTTDRDRAAAEDAAEEVRKVLDQLEQGEGATELDTLLVRLEDKIDFVGEEYRGYLTAKAEGDQDEADTELGEARAFTKGTQRQVRENAALLQEANATAYEELETTLDELARLLNETAPRSEVLGTVNASIALLSAFETETPPSGPAVDVQIGPAEPAGGALEVPVALTGLPQDGFSIQATLTYDPAAFTIKAIEIPTQVGASDTSTPGEARFNAASTESGEGPVTVAVLTVTPGTSAAQANLDLSIETLTDAEGDPLRVGNVTGTDLDLSNSDGADPAGQAAPGPGLLAALAGLALSAFVAGRRRR